MNLLNKINYILVLTAILIFPLGVIVRFNPFRNVNIYPSDFIVGIIFCLIAFQAIKKRRLENYKGIGISILLFNIIGLFSLLVSPIRLDNSEMLVSISYLIRLNIYFSLFMVGIFEFTKTQYQNLKKFLIGSSAVFVLLGFIQLIFYNNLRNLYYLGWDEHLYRLFSTFLDPNFAGLFFALLSLLLIGLFVKFINRPLRRSISLSMASFALLALLFTFSRTAIISFLVGISYFLIASRKKIILASFITVFLIGMFWTSDFSVEGMNPVRIASSEARIKSIEEAFEIFIDNPILGVGFNSYRYAQIEKGFRGEPIIQSNADAGTDNSFLFILATTGIIGLITYLNIWRNVFSKVTLIKDAVDRRILISIILAFFIGSFFINALFYAPLMLWMFLLIGIEIRESNLRN